jgi:hypothetical protein
MIGRRGAGGMGHGAWGIQRGPMGQGGAWRGAAFTKHKTRSKKQARRGCIDGVKAAPAAACGIMWHATGMHMYYVQNLWQMQYLCFYVE